MAKNGRPDNSKRPRQTHKIFRRLHPRQQCSSAVATERGGKPPFSVERAPRPDSPGGQEGRVEDGQYCCAGQGGLSVAYGCRSEERRVGKGGFSEGSFRW